MRLPGGVWRLQRPQRPVERMAPCTARKPALALGADAIARLAFTDMRQLMHVVTSTGQTLPVAARYGATGRSRVAGLECGRPARYGAGIGSLSLPGCRAIIVRDTA